MVRGVSAFLVCLWVWPVALAQAPDAAWRAAFTGRLVAAAMARAQVHVRYVPDYVKIGYPGGDVPADTGVCSDEIIRIYRVVGIDLQKEVHEDMLQHLAEYPVRERQADSNIDHRRVPNLGKFFARHGSALPVTRNASDYKPGDIVTWDLDGKHTPLEWWWTEPISGDATRSCITLARDRRLKMCCSTGRSRGTIVTTAPEVETRWVQTGREYSDRRERYLIATE
jgi:uncharacterized protein YijF (DUF1287 family)